MEEINRFWSNVGRKARDLVPLQVFPAVVKEVDEDLRTCTVRVNDNVDFVDVRLYALADTDLKGFCLIPAVDSTVMVARIANGNELLVTMFSVVDKVVGSIGEKVEFSADGEQLHYINDKTDITVKSAELAAKLDGVTLEIKDNKVKVDADEISFNGGGNKGLVKVEKLISSLNKIESDINDLKTGFNTWVPVPKDGGALLKTGLSKWIGSRLPQTQQSSLEDTNVKH